jgi:hypothetical protein
MIVLYAGQQLQSQAFYLRPDLGFSPKPLPAQHCPGLEAQGDITDYRHSFLPSRCLFIYAVFLGGVYHRLDIFRLCLIKCHPIGHKITAAFAAGIDELLDAVFHLLGGAYG